MRGLTCFRARTDDGRKRAKVPRLVVPCRQYWTGHVLSITESRKTPRPGGDEGQVCFREPVGGRHAGLHWSGQVSQGSRADPVHR
jgi:hypothetical protein